jgi:hypothetical protein
MVRNNSRYFPQIFLNRNSILQCSVGVIAENVDFRSDFGVLRLNWTRGYSSALRLNLARTRYF